MMAQMQRRHEIKNRLFGSNVNLFEFNLKLINIGGTEFLYKFDPNQHYLLLNLMIDNFV